MRVYEKREKCPAIRAMPGYAKYSWRLEWSPIDSDKLSYFFQNTKSYSRNAIRCALMGSGRVERPSCGVIEFRSARVNQPVGRPAGDSFAVSDSLSVTFAIRRFDNRDDCLLTRCACRDARSLQRRAEESNVLLDRFELKFRRSDCFALPFFSPEMSRRGGNARETFREAAPEKIRIHESRRYESRVDRPP